MPPSRRNNTRLLQERTVSEDAEEPSQPIPSPDPSSVLDENIRHQVRILDNLNRATPASVQAAAANLQPDEYLKVQLILQAIQSINTRLSSQGITAEMQEMDYTIGTFSGAGAFPQEVSFWTSHQAMLFRGFQFQSNDYRKVSCLRIQDSVLGRELWRSPYPANFFPGDYHLPAPIVLFKDPSRNEIHKLNIIIDISEPIQQQFLRPLIYVWSGRDAVSTVTPDSREGRTGPINDSVRRLLGGRHA